jgi:post-segregation antitoxin (ccd killing protein)
MTTRLTISVPDELGNAVRAVAGDNVSAFTQRALRNELAARDLDIIAAHQRGTDDEGVVEAMEADIEAELAEQEMRRAS